MTCMLYKDEGKKRYRLAETTLCALQDISEKVNKAEIQIEILPKHNCKSKKRNFGILGPKQQERKSKKPQEKNNRLDEAGQPTLGGVDGVLRKRGYYQAQTHHQNRCRQTQ